jgi:hypothetical protein
MTKVSSPIPEFQISFSKGVEVAPRKALKSRFIFQNESYYQLMTAGSLSQSRRNLHQLSSILAAVFVVRDQ